MPHEYQRARLRDLLAEHEPDCAWCEVVGDSVRHAFLAEAIYADLLVVGPPAIVVPFSDHRQTIGERVLVAWNGSASAARALKASLPLLREAASVHVATWGVQAPVAPFSRLDVCTWLRRHGIDAELHHSASAAHVANDLAALAREVRADLVVMGGYGHSRIREQVFGGVTRALLAKPPAPMLLSH